MTQPEISSLRDIHLPSQPLLVTLEQALVTLLVGALVAFASWWLYRRLYRRRGWQALQQLDTIESRFKRDGDASNLARELSQLLRVYAVACFPQRGVEGLTGDQWLHFLDQHGGRGAFHNGPGSVLKEAPYRRESELQAQALLALVRQWIRINPS